MIQTLRTNYFRVILLAVLVVVLVATAAIWMARRPTPAPSTAGAVENTDTRAQVMPTFTPTPLPGVSAAEAPTTTGVLATPTNDPAISAGAQTGAAGDPAGATSSGLASISTTVQAAADPILPTPTPATDPAERLAQGRQLNRYGDYANARSLLLQLADDETLDLALRREARYDLARGYLADDQYAEAVATLDKLDQALQTDGADPNQFGLKEQFLRGEALLGEARFADAIAAYWRFLDAYPWMAEAVQPRIAQAYIALNDPASAAAAYQRAADASPTNLSKALLLEQAGRSFTDASQFTEAVNAYDAILAFAENAAYRAELQYQAGQALAAAGDGPGAIERWQAATTEEPESKSAYLSLVELVNRNVEFDLFQRGYIDLYADAYEPAINAFQAFLDATGPTDARYANALHRLGQSYLGAGQYEEAIARLDRVIAEFPSCDCFGQAWLHKALAQAGLGDTAGARRTYRTFAREYPNDPLAPEALWLSGRQALDEGNQIEAAVDFLALADGFPASERAPQALYALGVGAISKQLNNQAATVFERLQQNYPDYKWDAAAYWLGRAYAAGGEADKARAQWQALVARAQDIYYGVLAGYALADVPMTDNAVLTTMAKIAGPASRLEGDDGTQAFAEQWLRTWMTGTEGVDLAVLPTAVGEDQDLAKGKLLLELGQRGPALIALQRVFDQYQNDPHALYPLSLEFSRIGAYQLSLLSAARLLILSGAELVEDGPSFIQRMAYPQPFGDLITREAQANDVSPLVYFSLIRQESLFEEGAESVAAAQGLAQIVPDTGHWIAEQLGHPEYTNDIIYRPVVNLRFGVFYLDWVRDYLNGNLVSALAGYNAGPGNAKSWRESAGADDTIFAEILTFTEPRVYIQQVVANLYQYTRLYAQ